MNIYILFQKAKMKYFKKACVHDIVVASLNANKEKCMNYETSANGDTIGYICMHCHNGGGSIFFWSTEKV